MDSVRQAVDALVANLSVGIPPEPLSQHLPVQAREVASGGLAADPMA